MSGKGKKNDSEAVGIMKFFKCTERNTLSSKEPTDIAKRSWISSATESVQIIGSMCSATSSSFNDHSSHTCSGTEQAKVIATPTITDVQGKGEITATFDENSKLHNYYLCKSSDCCTISPTDTLQSLKAKFSHSWVFTKDLSFDKTSGLWWLVYEENKGMFCLLCRKHNLKSSCSKSDVWNTTPSVRLRREAVQHHLTTTQHKEAIKLEMMQRVSTFEKQVDEKHEVNENKLEKTFTAIYWLAKEEISNQKLIPLLELLENLGVSELKYFQHRSRPSVREMFITLGESIQEIILGRIRRAKSFGILADEAADVAVLQQLIIFLKYVNPDTGVAKTEFLATKCIDDPRGANAEVITDHILDTLKECDVEVRNLKSFVSDGASVMTGEHNGVAARLKRVNKVFLNFHCICHRLALACADTGDSITYIVEVESLLKETWKFFQNSPKRTSIFMKVQTELKDVALTEKAKKIIGKKIRKACRTRWLSLEQSVNSVFETYAALLHTFQELKKDALAVGLLTKMKTVKFLGTIYILKEVVPCLTTLSKTFQAGALNFSHVGPAINHTQASLEAVKSSQSPLKKQDDIKPEGRLGGLELTITDNDKKILGNLLSAYVSGLAKNITSRFNDCLSVLSSFSILSPVALPNPTSPEFKDYGNKEIKILADHFFQEKETEDKEVTKAQLEAEWAKFRFDLDAWKSLVPPSKARGSSEKSAPTPLEWALQRVVKMKSEYGYFYPLIVELAEVALSAPITNAWPERGASAVKRIKTRLRNRLKNDMLNSLLHVSINGPAVSTAEAKEVIKAAVANWLQKKNRRLQRPPISTNKDTTLAATLKPVLVDHGTQCDSLVAPLNAELFKLAEEQLQREVHLAKRAFFFA
ncbi:zinc finger protein 862-like [Montipora capricornis]|uniref:zinc finger protein 862-like n=1 Tax=Montipora capricornis TaxID=246305 RepID=UPI0035F19ABF